MNKTSNLPQPASTPDCKKVFISHLSFVYCHQTILLSCLSPVLRGCCYPLRGLQPLLSSLQGNLGVGSCLGEAPHSLLPSSPPAVVMALWFILSSLMMTIVARQFLWNLTWEALTLRHLSLCFFLALLYVRYHPLKMRKMLHLKSSTHQSCFWCLDTSAFRSFCSWPTALFLFSST